MPSVQVGVIFQLNGKTVPVSVDDVIRDYTSIRQKGIDFTLPGRIELGSFNDLNQFIQREFPTSGFALPAAENLPNPLDDVYKKATTVVVSVESFHLKIHPTNQSGIPTKPPEYSLGLSAVWPVGQDISLVQNVLSIKGLFVNLTNKGDV